MSENSFKRVSPTESRIYDADGDHVGDVYAHDDILRHGRRVYLAISTRSRVAGRPCTIAPASTR